jgi:hypothetical protein
MEPRKAVANATKVFGDRISGEMGHPHRTSSINQSSQVAVSGSVIGIPANTRMSLLEKLPNSGNDKLRLGGSLPWVSALDLGQHQQEGNKPQRAYRCHVAGS